MSSQAHGLPQRVLLLGSGGREHAIAASLVASSSSLTHLFVAPGNPGTAALSTSTCAAENVAVSGNDSVLEFCASKAIEMVVVGPEAPLADGIAGECCLGLLFQAQTVLDKLKFRCTDALEAAGIPCFGPSKAASQLESSKAYSKDFMQRNGIPTAPYAVFSSFPKAKAYLDSRPDIRMVVKASGLAAGKGEMSGV